MLVEAKKYSVKDFEYYIILLTLNIMKELGFSFDENTYSKEAQLEHCLGLNSQNVTYNSLKHETAHTYLSMLKANLQHDMHNKRLPISTGSAAKRDKKRLITGIGLTTAGIGVSSVSAALIATGKIGALSTAAGSWVGAVTAAGAGAAVEAGGWWLGSGIVSMMTSGLTGGAVAGGITLTAFAAPIVSCIVIGVGGSLAAKSIHNYFKKHEAELIRKYKKNDIQHIAELIFSLSTLHVVEKLSKKRGLEDLDESKIYLMAQKEFKLLMKNLVKQVKQKRFPHLISDELLPDFMPQENCSSAKYELKIRELSFRHWLGALEQTIMKKNHSAEHQRFLVKLSELRQKTEQDLANLKNFRDYKSTIIENNKHTTLPFQTSKKGLRFFSPQNAHESNLYNTNEKKHAAINVSIK